MKTLHVWGIKNVLTKGSQYTVNSSLNIFSFPLFAVFGGTNFGFSAENYKFRPDHLGYQLWTKVYTIPDIVSGTITISYYKVTLTV